MLSVLDVFTPEKPAVNAEELVSLLGFSRGTTYRYLRELCAAGLLSRSGSTYSLGPRIIGLDFHIRQVDPILRASQPVLKQLSEKFECDVLLTTIYEDHVIVTHHEQGSDRIQMSFGRGRTMPLFKGCGSKAILSALPSARLAKIYKAHVDETAAAGLGRSWSEFRRTMAAIRRANYVVSKGELDPGNIGVAAPISPSEDMQPGAIIMVFRKTRYEVLDEHNIKNTITAAAEVIEKRTRQLTAGRPPELAWLEAPVGW
jgi:DNA-binding IclR family transcriptional regulator